VTESERQKAQPVNKVAYSGATLQRATHLAA
jgi:hypothetical protein